MKQDKGHLFLDRRLDQTIVINGNIKVKVLSIQGGKVRLGIDAPANVKVVREELLEDDK